jgi:hypothetical protein
MPAIVAGFFVPVYLSQRRIYPSAGGDLHFAVCGSKKRLWQVL